MSAHDIATWRREAIEDAAAELGVKANFKEKTNSNKWTYDSLHSHQQTLNKFLTRENVQQLQKQTRKNLETFNLNIPDHHPPERSQRRRRSFSGRRSLSGRWSARNVFGVQGNHVTISFQ